jgi:hypothetical protein
VVQHEEDERENVTHTRGRRERDFEKTESEAPVAGVGKDIVGALYILPRPEFRWTNFLSILS